MIERNTISSFDIQIQLALSCKVWWEDSKRAGWNFLTTFSFEEKTKLSDWSLSDQLTQSNNHKPKYIWKSIIVLMPHIDLHDKKWWKIFCLWVCVIDPPQKNSRKKFFYKAKRLFCKRREEERDELLIDQNDKKIETEKRNEKKSTL